jgi:UDP-N-acetylglucosamine 2-epimerase (non-hydrolysing)
MKVVTWLGTRPEIIRLSRIIPLLDRHCHHVLIHTGQNYDESLSDVFFRELGVRQPDLHLGIASSSFGAQAGAIVEKSFDYLAANRPDRLLILGDTNSGLAAIAAVRLRIPVYHMEAGNRCFDDRVPEEINRRIIDHSSAVLMPYTHRSKENLLREGIERRRIAVTGNPIHEVLQHYGPQIEASDIIERLGLEPRRFFLTTLHRAENVDEPERLQSFLSALAEVADCFDAPVIVSVHPRTKDKLARFGLSVGAGVRLIEPLGFFDFVNLEQRARCVLSDSGTVQEECCLFGVPNVTLRDVTERAETIECGSNILSGADPRAIIDAVTLALESPPWRAPDEYLAEHVSYTVAKIVLGYAP